eukprot:3142379-Amphidinium_carterae.1
MGYGSTCTQTFPMCSTRPVINPSLYNSSLGLTCSYNSLMQGLAGTFNLELPETKMGQASRRPGHQMMFSSAVYLHNELFSWA